MSEVKRSLEVAELYDWFACYCASFRGSDAVVQRNFDLKELHTHNVCEAARAIARGGEARRAQLAEIAAICHDLGRFPQFRDYGTFKDSESVNHAHLSVQVIVKNGLLDFLPEPERESVIAAVRLHNAFAIPAELPDQARDLLKLVRDADKVDIWRVFIDYYSCPEGERASGTALGFPDLPVWSPEVMETLRSGQMVQLSTVKTLNDLKLLQLSWVYDINFRNTLQLIKDKGLLEQLAATLPAEGAVADVLALVQDHLVQKLSDIPQHGEAA